MRWAITTLVFALSSCSVLAAESTPWKFAVLGDTHIGTSSIVGDMAPEMVADGVKLVLFPGDIVNAGKAVTAATYASQLATWKSLVAPLYAAGIGVYPVRGNHEDDAPLSVETWNAAFAGNFALPANGPTGESNLSYSFNYKNALFVGLDNYVNIHRVNQTWLDQQLAANSTRPHVFVFGHEAAFKVFHTDNLDDFVADRDAFWRSLKAAGARTYFAGHDHFYDVARIDDGDGNTGNDLYQVIIGTGGGNLHDQYNYFNASSNSTYIPTAMSHIMANGYLLVEVSGESNSDLGVKLTFKQRSVDANGRVSFAAAHSFTYSAASRSGSTGSITLTEQSAQRISVTLSPSVGDVGKTVSVWFGAVFNGVLYVRDGNRWTVHKSGTLPVAIQNLTLATANSLTVAENIDLSTLPGIEIYVGYGNSETDMLNTPGRLVKVYQATQSPVTMYALSAQINGLTSDGLVVSYAGSQLKPVAGAISLNMGNVASGSTYTVAIQAQPSGLSCTIDKPTGTVNANTTVTINCAAIATTSVANLTRLAVGSDQNILKRSAGQQPAQGKLWLCAVPSNGAGAAPSSDWLNADGTWDYTRKPKVNGADSWASVLKIELAGSKRVVTGNGLPNHPTGSFPITRQISPDAVKYDANPSSIKTQTVNLTFDSVPSASASPNCVPYGASGILLTGSAVYHGASTLGTDAVAYEMLDEYGGHSDGTGTYHYHFLSPSLETKLESSSSGHSSLMGYMMDGFGLYGSRGDDGKVMANSQLDECHGHTHTLAWDGEQRAIYHYHWTYDFPYNVGCFRGVPVIPWNGRSQ